MTSACHPPKPALTKDGRCAACYHRDRRQTKRKMSKAVAVVRSAKPDRRRKRKGDGESQADWPETVSPDDVQFASLVVKAERVLQEGIVVAASALVRSIDKAADKGDARPALALLGQYPIPAADGTTRRLLEPPPKPAASSADERPSVIVGGIFLSGPKAGQRMEPPEWRQLISDDQQQTIDVVPGVERTHE